MIRFVFRKNNFYPLMLLLFILLRLIIDKILKIHPYKNNIDFLISFLIFFSQSLIGSLSYLYYNCRKKKEDEKYFKLGSSSSAGSVSNYTGSIFIPKINEVKDTKAKKIFLIIFASFFNFVGCIIRSADILNFGKREENNGQLEVRIRSIQIIISSLLCFFTLRLNIYKHQKLSLIVISVLLVVIISLEFVITSSWKNKIASMVFCIISCLSRAFLDVTEKYLFDYDYINILFMLIYEGLIGLFLFIIYFIVNKTYQEQGKNILEDMSKSNWQLATFILLILAYTVISGFRNAYRVTTNKFYSPMSRALFESTLDPFVFIYNFFTIHKYEENYVKWIYFSVVLFSLLVIAFFSLIYNDFLVLNCCGLAYNTYSGINSRLGDDNIERQDTIIDIARTKSSNSTESNFDNYEMQIIK